MQLERLSSYPEWKLEIIISSKHQRGTEKGAYDGLGGSDKDECIKNKIWSEYYLK